MRKRREEGEGMGSDSFLDVVANMVGIVIILVMVAGLRSRQAPKRVAEKLAGAPEVQALVQQEAAAQALKAEVQRLADETAAVGAQGALAFRQREALAFEAARGRRDLEQERQALDATRRTQFDHDRRLAAARAELSDLERRRAAAAETPAKQVQIINYATPISRLVEGKEEHFQLRGGLIARVPMDEFVERVPDELKQQAWKLRQLPEVTSTIGPIDGFRMRYLIVRAGNMIRLQQFELLPVSKDLGEPLQVALAPGSEFSRTIAGHTPRRTTITLWVYPDSFSEFRALKDHLRELGFVTAGRPLPADHPIGASIYGSRSAAQ